MLRGCISRVRGKVFVVSIGHFCFAALQGVGGGTADMGGGAVTAYHHHVVRGCFLGRWLCLCVSFVVVFLACVFLILGG